MRVLEADPSILYKMGKNKKHKIRKAKENDVDESSDDAQLSGCSHITKAVNINTLRKGITKSAVSIDECTGCVKEGTKSVTKDLFGGMVEGTAPVTDGEEADNIVETTICVCLQCGHQGCDRNSANKHALKHHKTPHTGLHCIIVNLTTWSTWCYLCDDEVTVTPRIQGCIEFLQKTCGIRPNRPDTALSVSTKANEAAMAEATSSYVNSPAVKPSTTVSCAKVKGLSNLGNTCFFNAVMQSICQTRGLENLLLERSKQEKMIVLGPPSGYDSDSNSSEDERDEDYNEKMKPLPTIQTVGGEPGPVTLALLGFMQEMRGGSKNGVVNPTVLFTQVCKKAPRFKGFQQQDSHELLRYLIDSIRTEEIRKGQCSILKFFKLSETINPKRVDDETKMKIKEYGRQVKHTFVDSVFGGQLVSTVKCEECKNVSQIYEAFLDLSLPVMEEKPQRPFITLIGKKKDAMVLNEDGDVMAASNMGLDSCYDKPSKYQDKKNKRNAKKDAKKKVKSQKSKTLSLSQFVTQDDGNDKGSGDQDNASEDSSSKVLDGNESCEGAKAGYDMMEQNLTESREKDGDALLEGEEDEEEATGRNSSPEGSKEGLDTNRDDGSSSKDDPSDADIEDNLEGDQSRVVISLQNGSHHQHPDNKCLHSSAVSHDVTLPLPPTNGVPQSSNAMDSNSKDVDSLVDKVGDICLQENGIGDVETIRMQDSNTKCDMFTVDTTVSNCSDCLQQNGEAGACGVGDEDCEKDNSSLSLGDNTASCATLTEKDKAEVTAVFSISLPEASSQTEGDNVISSSQSQNSVKVGDLSLSKGKAESCGETEQQQEDKALSSSSVFPMNGTKSRNEYLREAKQYSMNTLAPRYHAAPKECSILSCLNQFTAAELLTGSNKVGCKSCTKNKWKNALPQKEKKGKDTVYSNANKQYLIFRPPAVLTLHLKRFEQTGLTSRKVNRHVDFPLTLDLAPYCSSLCSNVKDGQSKVLYSLYGIVEHSGRLNGGHYTAYVKLRPGVAPHTQFLNTQPRGSQDILNIYMERILKLRTQSDGAEAVDKDVEARAECLSAPGRWFHISDSRVNEVTEACVMKAQAYLLFYERIF